MVKSKEQLEAEINGTIYFSITGSNMETLKKSELNKISALVFEYFNRFIYKSGKASHYADEIYHCTGSCLKKFDSRKGIPFLNYLSKAVSNSIKRADSREQKNAQLPEPDNIQNLADGDFSLIETQQSRLPGPEEDLLKKEQLIKVLDVIENVFQKKQARVKPFLKKLATREFFDFIVHFYRLYSFTDMEMVRDVMLYKKPLPSQRKISESFGKRESEASRTINDFKKEIEKSLVESVKFPSRKGKYLYQNEVNYDT